MAITLKLPLVIVDDYYLVRISEENEGYQFEREEDGSLTVSPNFTLGGARSGNAFSQLYTYALRHGGRAFLSSVGFSIGPYRAIKSPDVSWIGTARIDALTEVEAAGFWPLSPDVTIEVKPDGDDFDDTIAKIEFYMKHGTRYAVAIDSLTREVVERGEAPEGLSLDFDAIIDA